MEMPPSMPSCGLKVFFASAAPSGTQMVTRRPPSQFSASHTARTACSIILRGTRLMAAAPTGWSSPGFVTRPTPGPPSITTPGCAARSTRASISAPCVASMSSPPSFATAQQAVSPAMRQYRGAAVTGRPPGVVSVTLSGARPPSSRRAAPAAASAAQVPVV